MHRTSSSFKIHACGFLHEEYVFVLFHLRPDEMLQETECEPSPIQQLEEHNTDICAQEDITMGQRHDSGSEDDSCPIQPDDTVLDFENMDSAFGHQRESDIHVDPNTSAGSDNEQENETRSVEVDREQYDYGCTLDEDNGSDWESVGDDSDEEVERAECLNDEPLYDGSRLTVLTSILLITTFVMRHGLTGECIQDLLMLIELHCLSENICCTSSKLFCKYFADAKAPIQKHYYCAKCNSYMGMNLSSVQRTSGDACQVCGHTSTSHDTFFVVNPIESVLRDAFARKYFSFVLFGS